MDLNSSLCFTSTTCILSNSGPRIDHLKVGECVALPVMEVPQMGQNNEHAKTAAAKPPLLDASAVAEALGTTRRHVQRLVAERRIPFVKVGRFVRFDPAALDIWLDTQRVDAVPRPSRYGSSWR